MMTSCVFCDWSLEPRRHVVIEHDTWAFLQLEEADRKGAVLEGAGVLIPKAHRETVFDLTSEEWNAMHALLQDVYQYMNDRYEPSGYTIGWNSGEIGGQHIRHAHMHVFKEGRNARALENHIRSLSYREDS
jgi:histidine triad (HIT) family protein